MSGGARSIAKFLMAVLIAANLLVAAAWLAQDRLTAYGILPAPEPVRIELEPRPLPAIGSPPQGSSGKEPGAALADAADSGSQEDPGPEPTPQAVGEDEGDDQLRKDLDAPANVVCAVVGPFSERTAAQAAATAIRAAGGSVEWRPETVSTPPAYHVYVVPAVAKNAAVETWRALRAQSIEAFIIPSGERKNGISVGVFAEQRRAEAQRQRVAELGFTVRVAAMNRSATVFRLLAKVAPEALAGQPHVACAP